MTTLGSVVTVTVNIGGIRITQVGFGTPLLAVAAESSIFTARVKSYASITEVAVDFVSTTKPHRMASAIFSQDNSPETIKIGRIESGDADLAASLAAIEAEDDDWYGLLLESVADQDILDAATFTESRVKIFIPITEEEDVIAVGAADVASVLQAATRNRTGLLWHHHAGRDDGGSAMHAVASGVTTVTETAHGLEIGDPLIVSGSGDSTNIDGSRTVATVPLSSTFTFATPDASDDAGPTAIAYFAGYTYGNAAWAGKLLATTPGSATWKFKQLAGIDLSSTTDITTSEEAIALAKAANLYTPLGSTGAGHTHEGEMASGRFLDIQRGIDWLTIRLQEDIATLLLNAPKIPYTDQGVSSIVASAKTIFTQGVTNGLLGPLLDSSSGEFFRFSVPKVSAQTTANRADRFFAGIEVEAQLAGAIHKVSFIINAQV